MKPNPFTYGEIDSTNAEAARLLREGSLPEGMVITADYQSGGRGQGKNVWVSDPGKNILMSWIVYPAFLSVKDQFQLSKAVSLAITDFLSHYAIDAEIKWPNDILCHGSKICGILIEHSVMGDQLRHCIVGIGLNVQQEVFPEFPWKATSLVLETAGKSAGKATGSVGSMAAGSVVDSTIDTLVQSLKGSLDARYSQLAGGEAPEISASYLQRLYRLNEPAEFTDGVSRFTGMIRGVDDTGQILVERGTVTRSYGFHEVQMVY